MHYLTQKTLRKSLAITLFTALSVTAYANTQAAIMTDGDIVDGEVQITDENAITDNTTIDSIEKDGKRYSTLNLSQYAQAVNEAEWSKDMKVNTAMTVKIQVLLDWNHASPGPIDGGWGMNSKKALINFQRIRGLDETGKMNAATWHELNKEIPADQPVLVSYTLTADDVKGPYKALPNDAESKSKLKALSYENVQEMLGERFHMDVKYLKKLNANKQFKAGETITVINTGSPLKQTITRVVADREDKILYAYNGLKLVAAYPTTIGSIATATPSGTFKVINKVKMPEYKATVNRDSEDKKTFILPPGPNSPVGVVWMGLNKPSYGIHGSPIPEGISRQQSLGCIRLTNWDVLEVHANIKNGATVEIK
ncbi:L,D-transpeptidase [Moraxella nasovis]|uniref:L,D-transpeptidase family protein n=1 Tax=Moraxella nasovis TaxID=2904121 RepID=UPI001F603DD9|nr:L,D-transpeptidase [Moraxella nasovis]UNU73157.1 L,D-transpeptidase [Moraxella nasovis]